MRSDGRRGGRAEPAPRTIPAGITVSIEDNGLPRSFAERTYTDIRHWRERTLGGHFMAMEEPEFLTDELRRVFRGMH
jgi:epoxide hydrolase